MPRIRNTENRPLLLAGGTRVPAMGVSDALTLEQVATLRAQGSELNLILSSGLSRIAFTSLLDTIGWDRAKYPLRFGKVGGKWRCDFRVEDYFPEAVYGQNVFWCDWNGGNNANDGRSAATAKKSLRATIVAANATGAPYRIMAKAGVYPRNNAFWSDKPSQSCQIIGYGGRVVCAMLDAITWPGAKNASYPNTTSVARSAVAQVLDLINPDSFGDYRMLTPVADAAACNGTPNSFVEVSGTLYVNRADGLVCTESNTRVLLGVSGANGLDLGAEMAGKRIHLKGIDFEGGGSAMDVVRSSNTAAGMIAIFEDCSSKYAGSATVPNDGFNCFGMYHTGLAVYKGCKASKAGRDGFNYHSSSPTSASFCLTIDCESYDVGRISSSTSNNGLTIHETVVAVDVAGNYHDTRGGTVRNVGTSKMLCLGTKAGPDTTDGSVAGTSFMVNADAKLYLIDCVSIGSTDSLNATDASVIAHRGSTLNVAAKGAVQALSAEFIPDGTGDVYP